MYLLVYFYHEHYILVTSFELDVLGKYFWLVTHASDWQQFIIIIKFLNFLFIS